MRLWPSAPAPQLPTTALTVHPPLPQLKEGFSESESRALFASRLDVPLDHLPPEAEELHQRCGGSPMMIALLSSYLAEKSRRRESKNRWHRCLDILQQGKHE